MLTPLTQVALAVLNDIARGEASVRSASFALCPHSLSDILIKLEAHGLIILLPERSRADVRSYALTRPKEQISLLQILEAIGEHLNCNSATQEELYYKYGTAARKLGIVNQITRQYLSEIKLIDL